MSELLKGVVLKRKGSDELVSADDTLKGKVVALYFSAHWCPPCRAFTPVLRTFYEALKDDGLEIVFVSFDRSTSDMNKYLDEAHGEWLYFPYGDANIQNLGSQFKVSGIPALVVVKADGTVITMDGRSEVQTKTPKDVFAQWKAKQ